MKVQVVFISVLKRMKSRFSISVVFWIIGILCLKMVCINVWLMFGQVKMVFISIMFLISIISCMFRQVVIGVVILCMLWCNNVCVGVRFLVSVKVKYLEFCICIMVLCVIWQDIVVSFRVSVSVGSRMLLWLVCLVVGKVFNCIENSNISISFSRKDGKVCNNIDIVSVMWFSQLLGCSFVSIFRVGLISSDSIIVRKDRCSVGFS